MLIGIGGGERNRSREEPTIRLFSYSIMNYQNEPFVVSNGTILRPIETDCAPYPFDIMAIYSLYQTSQ